MASQELLRVLEAQRHFLPLMMSFGDTDEARAAVSAFVLETYATSMPDDVLATEVDAGGVSAVQLLPPGADPDRVLLYLHGGGFMMGRVEEGQETLARIARACDSSALLVRYRLAPEHAFPAALDDAVAAYRWVRASGVASRNVVVIGDSAGGGLALGLLLRLRDAGEELPAACVAMSPFADLAATGASLEANADSDPVCNKALVEMMAVAYLQGANPQDPYASPLYGDLSGLPPLLVQVGSAEGLLDDGVRFAERARAQGVDATLQVWDDMLHQFQFYAWLPEATDAVASIITFVESHMPAGGGS